MWQRQVIGGPSGPYLGTYWGFLYDTMSASSTREGMLVLDLIDAKNKDLAWRLYLMRNRKGRQRLEKSGLQQGV
jgi:hypothetical protein